MVGNPNYLPGNAPISYRADNGMPYVVGGMHVYRPQSRLYSGNVVLDPLQRVGAAPIGPDVISPPAPFVDTQAAAETVPEYMWLVNYDDPKQGKPVAR